MPGWGETATGLRARRPAERRRPGHARPTRRSHRRSARRRRRAPPSAGVEMRIIAFREHGPGHEGASARAEAPAGASALASQQHNTRRRGRGPPQAGAARAGVRGCADRVGSRHGPEEGPRHGDRCALRSRLRRGRRSQASNSSATSAYVRANYALVAAGKSHLGASIAAYKGVLAKVRRDCPRAAEGSPQNPDSTKLSNEVIGAMVLSAGQPDRPAVATYLRSGQGPAAGATGSVTRAVKGYAAQPRKALRAVGAGPLRRRPRVEGQRLQDAAVEHRLVRRSLLPELGRARTAAVRARALRERQRASAWRAARPASNTSSRTPKRKPSKRGATIMTTLDLWP